MDEYVQYKKLKDEYESYLSKHSKTIIKSSLLPIKDVFKTSKVKLLAIRWSQYTPHFNDGAPCVFGVNELKLKFDILKDIEDMDEDFIDEWAIPESFDDDLVEKIGEACAIFSNLCVSDLFLDAFGDHNQVTYDFEKFKVEEYEHD